MYQAELHRENLQIVQGWQAFLTDMSRAFRRLGAMLSLSRSQTLSTFEVHRVPGADSLR